MQDDGLQKLLENSELIAKAQKSPFLLLNLIEKKQRFGSRKCWVSFLNSTAFFIKIMLNIYGLK